MNKQLSAIFLLAGTAIGSGMLSLPIVLAKYGLVFGCILMCFFAWLTYFSAIIRCELNINSDSRFSLRDVGLYFNSPEASRIGSVSLKLLSYSLMSAYLYGAASLLHSFFSCSLGGIILILSIFIVLVLCSKINIVNINKMLFVGLFVTLVCVILMLSKNIDFSHANLLVSSSNSVSLLSALPIVFTSFGFQGSLHSLSRFVNNDRKMIKTACVFGSIIPAIVYIAWIVCVISTISSRDPRFLESLCTSDVELSDLILCLVQVSHCRFIKEFTWIISILALLTSMIGVCLAIFDEWRVFIDEKMRHKSSKLFSAILTVIPSMVVAAFVPNTFIQVLRISGIILSVIAIFLPSFLYFKMLRQKQLKCSWTHYLGVFVILIVGIVMLVSGIMTIINEW